MKSFSDDASELLQITYTNKRLHKSFADKCMTKIKNTKPKIHLLPDVQIVYESDYNLLSELAELQYSLKS